MTNPPVNIAVIGAGMIGKRHILHILAEPLTKLAAIVEPFPIGSELAKQHNVPCYRTVDELLASGTPLDAAVISTPTQTHVPLACQLVNAGINVLVEKPVANSKEEAQVLIDCVAKQTKAKVLVGQHKRFNPYTVALKACLDAGDLGDILAVQGLWTARKGGNDYHSGWRIDPKSGGPISINAIHDIDLFRYLLGDISSIYTIEGKKTRGFEVEETGGAVLRFKSGAVGTFIFSDASASPHSFEGATGENLDIIGFCGKDCLTIMGTKGTISLPTLQLHYYPASQIAAAENNWNHSLSIDTKYADMAKEIVDTLPFTFQLRHFVRVIRGEVEPATDALEGSKSVAAVDALKLSMIEKRLVTLE